jgi:filamentous hemagglutinin family protein
MQNSHQQHAKDTMQAQDASRRPATSYAPNIELLPPSITMRVGNRRLTLSWRPRKPLPNLLSGLLRRSWRSMLASTLRVSLVTAAVCGAWNAPVMAAAPAPNTLPTGWSVVNGNVVFSQNGNVLNINQLTPQAIANFQSFSIGSNAIVDISQLSSASAFLARVTGGDVTQIYGQLRGAVGTLALINPNGILVGPGGSIDVGRFIASTLAISDSDFLAGRLTFTKGDIAGAVQNQGTIKSATGGSVYLIGSSVENSGIIRSPNGEVLLAAGETVKLVDTATPGVSVAVTGSAGSVTNLGEITASAGRIGIAAGLINNSGIISASSAVKEGGRIFLRASGNLTTSATSSISADGATQGGNITLYADNAAFIDGSVSATGAPGQGGFVETSGLRSLNVVNAPTLSSGGQWYIDPYDIEVVAGGTNVSTSNDGGQVNYAISSVGENAKIGADTITAKLNQGIGVTLTTGQSGTGAGNITVSSAIVKTGNSSTSLTLNAINNININADITDAGYGDSALSLNLNSNYLGTGSSTSHAATIGNGATIMLHKGVLTASEGVNGNGNGGLTIGSGSTVNLASNGSLKAGNLVVLGGGTLTGDTSYSVILGGSLNNAGTVNVTQASLTADSVQVTSTGTLRLTDGSLTATHGLNNAGTMVLQNGVLTAGSGQVINSGQLSTNVSSISAAQGFSNSGTLTLQNSNLTTASGQVVNNSNGQITAVNSRIIAALGLINSGTLALQNSNVSVASGQITNSGQFSLYNATVTASLGLNNSASGVLTLDDLATLTANLSNAGTVNANGSTVNVNGNVTNSGTLNITSSSMVLNGTTTNTGSLLINGTNLATAAAIINNGAGSIVFGSAGKTVNLNAYGEGDGAGKIVNNANISQSAAQTTANIRALENNGTLTIGANGNTLSISGGQQFVNTGTINLGGTGNTLAAGIGGLSNSATGVINLSGSSNTLQAQNSNGFDNAGLLALGGSGNTVNVQSEGGAGFSNSGTTNITGSGNTLSVSGTSAMLNSGAMNVGGSGQTITDSHGFSNTGTLRLSAGSLSVDQINSSGNISVTGGALSLTSGQLSGNVDIANSANVTLSYMQLNSGTAFTGAGNMTWTGNMSLSAPLTLAANGPSLTLDGSNGSAVILQGADEAHSNKLSTYNNVTVKGGTLGLLLDNYSAWDNYGSVSVNGTFETGSSSVLSNKNGGSINFLAASQLKGSGSFVNDSGGTVLVASGASVGSSGSFSNSGNVTLNGGSMTFGSISNNVGGFIGGNGTISSTGTDGFSNSGTLAPGGNGSVGSMTINGNYSQTASGTLMVDIAGDESVDHITFGGVSATFGGTLQTRLLNGYVPASDIGFAPFSFNSGTGAMQGSYFRNVTGDVLTSGGAKQMVKATYGEYGVRLALMGSDTFYATNLDGSWGNRNVWQDASGNAMNYLPTQIDTVVVNSSVSLAHSDGSDTIDKLIVNSGGALNVNGGNLTVSSATTDNGAINVTSGALTLNGSTTGSGTLRVGTGEASSANVTIANALSSLNVSVLSGGLTLAGNARFDSLSLSSGTVTGLTGSKLNVSESFTQTGGSMTLDDAALNQASGTLTVGQVTANNLVLQSENASVTQQSGTALRVKKQLITSSVTGTTLNNSGNQIAAFAANNSGSGNISLTNSLNTADTSVVALNGVTNAGGNVSISNTGGMITQAIGSNADFLGTLPSANSASAASRLALLGINTTGQVQSKTGSISLVTHSPLTIGSGGLDAAGNITLTAGNSGSSSDNLVINGLLQSAGGNINLSAGNSLTINANISTSPPGIAIFSVDNPNIPIAYAQGVTITDANGTRIPVPVGSSTTATSPVIVNAINNASQQQAVSTNQVTTTPVLFSNPVTQTVMVSPVPVVPVTATPAQTVGGSSGTFGGDAEAGDSRAKSSAKMYCS